MTSKPDLYFMQGGETSGFTSSGITSFQDIDPIAIVRELLQNSLDAGRDAGREVTFVRFEKVEHSLRDVPGVDPAYKNAFEQAVRDQKRILKGDLPDQAKNVIDAMEDCLAKERCETLYVLDNGIGLNPERMKGLLADGLSVKTGSSTGAVGNGHLTALPASDLRYVLYGGRYENGKTICAGHAVLASHAKQKQRMSKDGYFVSDLQEDFYDPYVFAEENDIPDYIRSRLDWISSHWKSETGTVVAIPAFNNFREGKKSLWEMVSKAAACNFFAAFASGELKVEVVEEGRNKAKAVDRSNIRNILEEVRDQKRVRGKFLSGSRAWSAFEAIRDGERHTVQTECGNLTLKILRSDRADRPGMDTSRIDLCRNGMWVADDLPKLATRRFSEMQPFHCVILLDARDGEIHRLVRKSEGPLHNELKARKWLKKEEKKNLENAMEMVYQKLKKLLPSFEGKNFRITEVLNVDVHGTSRGGRRRQTGQVSEFSRLRRPVGRRPWGNEETQGGGEPGQGLRTGTRGSGGKGQGGGGGGSGPRRGPPLTLQAAIALTGERSCIAKIIPQQTSEYAEICFAIDQNRDETWERRGMEQHVNLKNVRVEIDGREALINDQNGDFSSIRFDEKLEEGKPVTVRFEFTPPEGIGLSDDTPVGLTTQLFRQIRAASEQQSVSDQED